MSYDLSLIDENGEEIHGRNTTYNNAQLFYRTLKLPQGLYDLDGKKVHEVYDTIVKAIEELKTNRDSYTQYEPANKWGGIDDVIDVYTGILEAVRGRDDIIAIEIR